MRIPDNIPWVSTGQTLGSGGQGEVHLVTRREQPNGPRFALKILRNVDSKQARERFRREIEAAKQVDHPSIVKIIDQSEPDAPDQFYVMEYYEGARTLANIIFSGASPFHGKALACLDLFEQILHAIRACELAKPPVVHRDINPKNILVLADGSPRLIDFGICLIQDGQMLTLVDEDVGTRNYTAPECEAGNETQVGPHSDLYSVAKVLWSMITSQRAFGREEPAFTSRSMQTMFPTLPTTWHLILLFEKTIRASPGDRFLHAEQLLARTREVRYVIEQGYPPIEEVPTRCPSCGFQNLGEFPQGHSVFGNPNPRGVVSILCSHCGFGFVRNMDLIRENLKRLRELK